MGFFTDLSRSLFGGDSHQESQSTTQQTQNQNQTSVQSQKGTNTGTQSQTGQAVQTGQTTTSTLDEATLSSLKGLLPQLLNSVSSSGGVAAGDHAAIKSLTDRLVTNSNTNVDADITALQKSARQDFAQGEGAQISLVQQQIGSKGNSFAQQLQTEGDVHLQTKLAEIAVNAKSNARTQSDNEIASAIEGLAKASTVGAQDTAQPLSNLLALISSLSGAQQTTKTDGSTTSGSQGQSSQISDVISHLTSTSDATAKGSTTAAGNASTNNGWLNNIVGLFK